MTEKLPSCDICTPHSKKILCLNTPTGRLKYDFEVGIESNIVEEPIEQCPERDIILKEIKK